MGSASVWDPDTRARHRAQDPEQPPIASGLPSAELEALVAGIVQVTLDTRLTEWDRGRRAALSEELRARLLAIFGQPATPPSPASDAPLALAEPTEAPPPRVEPAANEADAATPKRAEILPASPIAQRLETLLRPRLAELGDPALAREDLRALLARLAERALEELPAGSPPPEAERLGQLEVLQRRAAKLERSLKEARSALAYVSGLQRIDTGLASIYRVVQGLSPDDPSREAKKSSLERIFQANLELQKRITKS